MAEKQTTEQKAQAKATREQTKAIQNEIGRLAAKGQKAPDLTDLLLDVAADEVFQALKDAYWDTDEKLTELEKLAKLINVHLAQMRVSKSAATASAPAIAAQPAAASPPPSSGGSEFVRRI